MKLSISEPCHENWNKMTPTEKGRFCGSCQKEVIDFAQMTKVEVKQFFIKKASESTCGRFESRQIDAFNCSEAKPKRINSKSLWIAAATFFIFANRGFSQGLTHPKPKQIQTDSTKKKTTVAMEAPRQSNVDPGDDFLIKDILKGDSLVYVRGQVLDTNGDTISFATILIEGTRIGTTSDFDGMFELLIPSNHQDSLTLITSFIGYNSVKNKFFNLTKTVDSVAIKMVEGGCNLQGLIIMGGPSLMEDPLQPKKINNRGVLRRMFRFR